MSFRELVNKEILRQTANRVDPSTCNVSRENEHQEASNEEVLCQITDRVDFSNEILRRSADITGMREITPPFYKEKVRPACDEISGADLKPEENFVPGIRSRFGLTGPTANLSQPEFVGRKIEHAWVSTLTRMFRTL
jgi:hypothetical protein